MTCIFYYLYLSLGSGTDEGGTRELNVGALPEGDTVVQGRAERLAPVKSMD